jgi:hypothetical protein
VYFQSATALHKRLCGNNTRATYPREYRFPSRRLTDRIGKMDRIIRA